MLTFPRGFGARGWVEPCRGGWERRSWGLLSIHIAKMHREQGAPSTHPCSSFSGLAAQKAGAGPFPYKGRFFWRPIWRGESTPRHAVSKCSVSAVISISNLAAGGAGDGWHHSTQPPEDEDGGEALGCPQPPATAAQGLGRGALWVLAAFWDGHRVGLGPAVPHWGFRGTQHPGKQAARLNCDNNHG